MPLRFDSADASEPWPTLGVENASTGDARGRAPADLDAPVVAADALVAVFRLPEPLEQGDGVGVEFAFAPFQRQHVVRPRARNLIGDLLLATHRVTGYDTPRHLQRLQKLGDGSDLVGLLVGFYLPERHAALAGPGADHVQGCFAGFAVVAAPERLAVDGDDLSAHSLAGGAHPPKEASLELLRGDAREDASEGVFGRNPIFEFQKALQPVRTGLPELLDGGEAVRAADHRADGDGYHLIEAMLLALLAARVFHLRKLAGDVESWMFFGNRHGVGLRCRFVSCG